MAIVYIAQSPLMQEWGGDVGISKFLYKVGLAEDTAKAAVEELNAEGYAGHKDWQLIGEKPTEMDAAALLARVSERQKMIDPLYYPKIKGAKDIVKLEQRKVEANLVIKRTMEGRDSKIPKLKPADMAAYILDSLG
ncbi:MAG: DUF1566 domain-containing protein [Rhodospirillaceae bacterium]|nr:DUF1566 domain-containing protein [Rhodospirillaceae bacterium]